MKRALVCLAVVICLLTTVFLLRGSVPVVGTGQWTTAADMSDSRDNAASVLLANGDTLIAGGSNSAGPLQTVDLYHSDGTLSAAASMQVALSRHTATLLQDGRVLVAGGDTGAGAATNSAEIYNPSSDSWTPAGTLNSARFGHSAILLDDGSVAIIGGESSGSPVSTIEIYDPSSNSFSQGPGLNVSRRNAAAAYLADGRVLVSGGFGTDANGNSIALKSAEIFDPKAGTVTAAADMNIARGSHSATSVLDGQVVVAGGSDGQADLISIEIYSAATDTWKLSLATLSLPRSGHNATLLPNNNSVLISGGASNGTAVQAADVYQPWTDAAISGGTMNAARANSAGSAFGLEGLYLAAGGSGLKSTELYRFPTIKTDKPDYAPGTPVLMTGTGYQSNETVNLNLKQDDGDPDTTTPVQADASGNISYQGFAPDVGDVGTHFHLTAIGQTSGLQAQTVFTDSIKVQSVAVGAQTPNPVVAGNQATYPVTITMSGSGTNGCTVTLSVTTALPTGATASFSPNGIFATTSTNPLTSTLTINTTGATPAGSTPFTVQASAPANGTGGQACTAASATTAASLVVTVQRSTSTTVSLNPASVVVGQPSTVSVTVADTAGAGATTPAGTVSFTSSDNGANADTFSAASCTLAAGTCSVTVTPHEIGTSPHTITGTYTPNDGVHLGSSSNASLTVNKANTTTTVTSSANPSVFGQSVTFTATVSATAPGAGTPVGTVTFLDGGSPIGTGTLSGGVSTFTTSALTVGNHTITTNYGGDGNFNGSTGSLTGNPQVVNKANTTTTVISSQNPSVFGQSVTFTATVLAVAPGAGTATGTLTFLDGGSPIGTGTLSAGIATFTTSALAVGNHTITTSYGGDGNFNGSTGSLTGNPQVVNKASTTTAVTSSVNPSVFGQSITFTATVSAVAPGSGTPVGTVTFLDGGSPIGTGTLSGGVATFTTSALTVGNHTITTNYGGDGNFNGSTGSLTGNPQVVNKASTTTTVSSSVNPSVFGQSSTFTATVSPVAPGSGTATGTVTFLDGGSPIGTGTLSGGIATFTTSALAVGNHTITTSYGGDGNFNGSTGSLTGNPQVVNKANTTTTVTSSVNPSVFGQSVKFTATVSPVAPGAGTPVGTVTFLDGGSPIGSGTIISGVATFTTSALSVGNHTITTNYGGDGNFNGSTGSLTGNPQVVNKASTTTTVTSSQNPSVFGQSVTFTATVSPVAPGSGTATGTVTFLDGGSPIGSGTLSGGIAIFTTSALTVGNHTITTSYGGDGNFNGSTGSLTGNPQVVNKASTTTTVTSSVNPSVFGQSITFTATVSPVAPGAGTPVGTVTFLDGGSPIGSGTIISGVATFTTSALAVGNHTITTNYGGDGNFNGSTGSLTGNPQVVNKASTTTTVTSSQNPSVFGQSVTFTATVSPVAPGQGTATGTVTFLDGGTPIGSGTLSGGIAIFTTSALTVGNHTITTSYGGDGNFNGSTGSLTGNPQVVNKASTSMMVTSSVNPSVFGQSVKFTATVSPVAPGAGTPVGTVIFLDGGSPIGTGTLSGGVATFTTSALAIGNHTITGHYGGDGNFNGTDGSLTGNPQVVNKADTTTTVTSSQNPSVFGQSITFTATVSPVAPGSGTATGTVTFLDGGSPIGTGTLSGGIAIFTTSALAVGSHTITTSYGGDGNFNGSTGSLTGNPQVVSKADTATTVTSSQNPSVFGQSVTFTATVSPVAPANGTPSGTVTFLDGGSPIGSGTLSGGIATFTTSALAVGSHTITTSYGGDGNFNGSTGSLTGNPQVVNKADSFTSATSSLNPSTFGQAVTFTATVVAVAPGSGTPIGTVTFLDGGSPIGSGTLIGGVATFTTSALAAGNHTITTNYGGDPNFNGSTGSLTGNPQVVNKADTATTVASSLNPSAFGQAVTFTATVSAVAPGVGTPTGTVTFLDGGSPIGSGTLSGGVATFTTSALAAGSHTITTNYGGDSNFNGSAGSLTGNPQVVDRADTTTSLTSLAASITLGDTVTFTATVVDSTGSSTGTPAGLVTFLDGSAPLGSGTLSVVGGNDQATFSTSLLAVGSHTITAVYDSDSNFNPSTSNSVSESVQLRSTSTAVALNPSTVVVGQPSTVTITVTDSGAVPPGTADTFASTGAPATGRTGFTATLFGDGLVLVAGGTDQNGTVLQSAEVYSVSGAAFTATGNLHVARTGASAVLLPNGKVLIAGGSSDGTANGALDSAELFDPASGTFALASQSMKAHRVGATATLLGTGKVLIAGGVNAGGVLASAELYDPSTDSFVDTGSLGAARTGASATLLGSGKVLIAGGSSDGTANGALNSAELFDPAGNSGAGSFTASGSSLSSSRWQPMAATLPGGKVLVAGGANSGGALTSADIYDASGDSFTASAQQMAVARSNGSAVSLPSGMVLLVGGASGSQTAELYDADSDKFGTTGNLQQLDNGAVATLLNNGQVLVVGLTSVPQSDAELFSPSFNPLGTASVTSPDNTDSITGACVLTPSNGTDSTCTSTVTPANVDLSPRNITGTYPADAIHSGSSGTASLTVNKADTATTVTSSVNPSVFGQSVTFTATVSPVAPGAGTPTGTVTFLDGGSPIGTGTLSGGIATFTTSALAVGNHTITTHYGGDPNFNGNDGSLTGNPQVVNKADTTTTVTSSVNPSVFGQSVTFTATVSPVAPGAGTVTGTVTFLDGGSPIGSGTISGGVATFTTSALAVGNHTITTSYGGDGNFNGSAGSLTGNPQVVNKADTSTTVTSSVNPSVFGQSVTFTATVSPVAPSAGTPTGTVTFLDGGSPIGTGTLSGGIATFTTSVLAVGNHTITTSYGGDGNFNGSSGSLTGNPQVVNKADTSTAVTSSVNPSVFGQSITFTATVSPVAPGAGTPTGTVTFLDGGSPIGTGTLSGGIATFTTSALAVGNHTITTSYGGDGNFNGSTGSLTGNPQVVNKANTTTTVTSSVNPSVFGQSVTFTATVSPVAPGAGTPTGTVTFLDGGSPIGAGVLSGGIAAFTTSALAVGNHTITTSYGGDGNFNGSTGSLTGNPQVVNKANTTTAVTSSVNPSVSGQSVTFTATVSPIAPGAGTPSGTVTFLDGGSPIGTGSLSGGIATFATSALAVGNHTITTSYGGDGNFNGSSGSLTGNPQVVNKADTTTTVTSSVNPSVFGQSVTFTATVSPVAPGAGTPSGTVTFLDGGSPIGTGSLSGGIATFATSALAVGNHTITTSYGGDGNFNGSTGSLTGNPQIVNKANTTTAVTSSANPSVFGQSVTFTATVSAVAPGSGTPSGSVSFFDSGNPIGTATLSGGVATVSTSALGAGNHTITTSYGGDGSFNGSTGSLSQNVNPAATATSVSSSQNPSTFGQAVSFTATVTNASGTGVTPTGSVQFVIDGVNFGAPVPLSAAGTATSGATSTLTVSGSPHSITATYIPADANFSASTGTLNQTVNPAATATSVSSSQNPSTFGQAVSFTATVTNASGTGVTHTGSVQFVIDGINFGAPVPLNAAGTATSGATSTLTVSGSPHSITATYIPADANFSASTGTLSQNVNKSNTTTAIVSSVNPSVFGQSVTFTATVSAVAPGAGTPTGTVTFLDGGSPIGTGTLTGGVASVSFSALSVGGHSITATYNSDANFNGSTSGALTQNVNKANTTTNLTSSVNPSAFGQAVTFTATVAPVAPGAGTVTGTVTFLDSGNPIGTGTVSGGTATFTTTSLSVGGHSITATYNGDGNFNGSTSGTVSQTVVKANTTTVITSVTPEPSILAAPYTVKWTVTPAFTGTPTGTVSVNDGNGNTCSAAVAAGQCTIPTSTSVGTKTLTATYSGDGNFNPSSGTRAHQVIFATGGTCDGDLGHSILQPINPGNPGDSVFKQGSTVPAKFRVCDANGNSIGTAGLITGFVLYQINSGVLTNVNELTADNSTNDLGWRFDPTAQQWIYNMSTKIAPVNKANQTYFFRIDLSDGTSIFFNYGLK